MSLDCRDCCVENTQKLASRAFMSREKQRVHHTLSEDISSQILKCQWEQKKSGPKHQASQNNRLREVFQA